METPVRSRGRLCPSRMTTHAITVTRHRRPVEALALLACSLVSAAACGSAVAEGILRDERKQCFDEEHVPPDMQGVWCGDLAYSLMRLDGISQTKGWHHKVDPDGARWALLKGCDVGDTPANGEACRAIVELHLAEDEPALKQRMTERATALHRPPRADGEVQREIAARIRLGRRVEHLPP